MVTDTKIKCSIISKSVTIIIFVEFIDQLIDYPINCASLSFDPLKPHFYIVKLGFTGVYIIVLISVQNIDCGYSLELPRRGGSNKYSQSMF